MRLWIILHLVVRAVMPTWVEYLREVGLGRWWQFTQFLKNHTDTSHNSSRARLLLRLALRGASVLARWYHQPSARGAVRFEIATTSEWGLLIINGKQSRAVWTQTVPSTATVTFMNEEVFLQGARGELDQLVALGKGHVRLQGHIPVADYAGWLMDEVSKYLA